MALCGYTRKYTLRKVRSRAQALTSIPLASLNVAQHHSPRPWWTCAICARRFHWASTYPYNRVSKEIAFQKHVTWQSLTASEPKPEKEALTRASIYWCFPAGQSTVSNIGYTLLGTWVWTTHAFWEADCSQVQKPSGASGTSFMGGPRNAGCSPWPRGSTPARSRDVPPRAYTLAHSVGRFSKTGGGI